MRHSKQIFSYAAYFRICNFESGIKACEFVLQEAQGWHFLGYILRSAKMHENVGKREVFYSYI